MKWLGIVELTCFLCLCRPLFSYSQHELKHVRLGNFNVGYQSHFELDYSRPSRTQNGAGRALQINVWYPAKAASQKPLRFVEYVHRLGNEDSLVASSRNDAGAIHQFLSYPRSEKADMDAWNRYLTNGKPMKAILNAPPLSGSFPVVLLMHGSAAEFSLLGEYLASHGMVAVNVPYKGYLQAELDVNSVGMETEIRDYEYALHFLHKSLKYKVNHVAALGVSFGAQSAMGVALRQKNIKGVISFDGGIGSQFGGKLLTASPFYHIEKINFPILHLYNAQDPETYLGWFDQYTYADRILIGFNHTTHAYFHIYGQLINGIPNLLGPSSPVGNGHYEALMAHTLLFMNEIFRGALNADTITSLHKKETWMKSISSTSVKRRL